VLGDPGTPHSWTYLPDIAGAPVILGADERGWGHACHVPANPPMTQRDIFAAVARLAGASAPRLRRVPGWQLMALGVLIPFLREFREVSYQFTRPFVVDSAAFQATFGTLPTPMGQALTDTVTRWHDQGRVAARKE
jgi:nucleoside-diphosphate-sugar epimerase